MLYTLLALALASPLPQGRTDPLAEPTPAELAARARPDNCRSALVELLPGVGPACTGRPAEGAFLIGLTAVEIGATGAVFAATDPPTANSRSTGRQVTLVALQDVLVYSWSRTSVDQALARGALYAPPDELPQMLAAPFDPRVLKRPAVFAGILALAGGGTALQYALDPPQHFWGRPNLFGATPTEALGYPLAAGMHGVLMSHVAVAEEIAFRGIIQSGAARWTNEVGGFAIGSAIFGPAHALNAVFLPPEERVGYLAVAVPWITLTGSWLGLVYMWGNYSLTGPIAMHWWYNMLVSATAFAANPQENLFSASVQMKW